MATFVGQGDRLITSAGRESWLKRGSVPFSAYAGGGTVSLSGGGAVSYQQLYESQPVIASCINKIYRQIARLPLKVYRPIGDDGTRERVRDHPLADLLRRPSPRRGPIHLKQAASFPTLLHGNSLIYQHHDTPGGPPAQLVALDWRYSTPHTDEHGQLLFWETTQTGLPRYLPVEDVLHFRWESGCGDLSVSPLRQLGVTARSEESAQRYQSASFDNGARPSGTFVLPADSKLRPEDRAEIRAELKRHAGVDQGGKVALIHGGAEWKSMEHTAVEVELIAQRKVNLQEIAAVYDVPPPLMGWLEFATLANVAEMHKMLYGMVLGPWLVMIEETFNAQLIAPYEPWAQEGLWVEFDVAEVLRSDTLKEVTAIERSIATGIMTPNEGRMIRNYPRSDDPDADRLFMPTNNMTVIGDTDATVSKHLDRAADRMRRKNNPDPERFERELAEDLNDPLAAQEWAQRVAEAPDEDAIRALAPA